MEEIDIIELLQRVKEGKAPVWIEVGGNKYKYYGEGYSLEYLYIDNEGDGWLRIESVDTDTKIKILDKPIIEELDDYNNVDIFDLARKVNEIIRYLNKENKE